MTWHRLLATSHALFGGASFENLRMPAYGGSLFDPARFPFLTATTDHGSLAVTVSDRVMLHVLRSVQIATVQGEARQITFATSTLSRSGTSMRPAWLHLCDHRADLPRRHRNDR